VVSGNGKWIEHRRGSHLSHAIDFPQLLGFSSSLTVIRASAEGWWLGKEGRRSGEETIGSQAPVLGHAAARRERGQGGGRGERCGGDARGRRRQREGGRERGGRGRRRRDLSLTLVDEEVQPHLRQILALERSESNDRKSENMLYGGGQET
jgi:hypothetical protein